MNNFFGNLKYKLSQWAQGRYGNDEFSKFLLIVTIAALVISFFGSFWAPLSYFIYLAIFAAVYSLTRSFSKNTSARYRELEAYLKVKGKIASFFHIQKRKFDERDTHVFYKCPQCKTTIRVPKGKGKIQITCPKCKATFIKTT